MHDTNQRDMGFPKFGVPYWGPYAILLLGDLYWGPPIFVNPHICTRTILCCFHSGIACCPQCQVVSMRFLSSARLRRYGSCSPLLLVVVGLSPGPSGRCETCQKTIVFVIMGLGSTLQIWQRCDCARRRGAMPTTCQTKTGSCPLWDCKQGLASAGTQSGRRP